MVTSKEKSMFIKLYMAKAYDRVKWTFLKGVLATFGFENNGILWVMSCISSSSFVVLINSELIELF